MIFSRTNIKEVVICEPKIFKDSRGYFSETFRQDKLSDFLGYSVIFCQDNESKSKFGVLRGLHYQHHPYAQSKLVRVIQGKVLDVAVDMRQGSPTFGQHVAVELSSENRKQLFIPRGFAHGFVVLSETAIFSYKVDNYYNPSCDSGLHFRDPKIDIDWILPEDELILSDKDAELPLLDQASVFKFETKFYD